MTDTKAPWRGQVRRPLKLLIRYRPEAKGAGTRLVFLGEFYRAIQIPEALIPILIK
jgi:hypothetical protein